MRIARRNVPYQEAMLVCLLQMRLICLDRINSMWCIALACPSSRSPDVVRLLKGMAAKARCLVIVDDLIRSRLGYAMAWIGTRLLSRSWVVHHDGPRRCKEPSLLLKSLISQLRPACVTVFWIGPGLSVIGSAGALTEMSNH